MAAANGALACCLLLLTTCLGSARSFESFAQAKVRNQLLSHSKCSSVVFGCFSERSQDAATTQLKKLLQLLPSPA